MTPSKTFPKKKYCYPPKEMQTMQFLFCFVSEETA